MSEVRVERYVAANHLEALVTVLNQLQATDDPYPRPVARPYDETSLRAWMSSAPADVSWVATQAGRAVGHIRVVQPSDYLVRAEGLGIEVDAERQAEVVKFFVSPTAQHLGIGRQLLATALAFTDDSGQTPLLAVLEGSRSAIRLYEQVGLRELGSFVGVQGVNHVYVGAAD